ncbi:MAG TPA: UbiX family flavin prenyltransferase [Archaeoglobus profundus]|nr:UbiX family flavin prenyltransferase [Archaeoglobus profundus]
MRYIVALTGASGQIYGVRLIEELNKKAEVYVIISNAAKTILRLETDYDTKYIKRIAHNLYEEDDLTAPISSGSFKHDGMVIAPCSVKTASCIAYGITDNLITRAADVTLKEKRKLIILIRETPLHLGHLRMLTRLAEIGAIIMPPVPAFYIRPKTLDDIINHTIARIMDLLGLDVEYKRWEGEV